MAKASWQDHDQDDDIQQALSEECVEAAPWINHPQKDALINLVAGGVSGALAKTAVAPLARLTILYQVQALQPVGEHVPSLLSALKQVIHEEGVRALWKGNLATILHRVPYAAVNFSTFELAKRHLQEHTSSDVLRRLAAGGIAGFVACTAAYPLDLVRTRLSAQRTMLPSVTRLPDTIAYAIGLTPDPLQPSVLTASTRRQLPPQLNYRGLTHAFRCIIREEGFRGLYRGLPATLAQVTPTLALNFCLYDSFRAFWVQRVAAAGGDDSTPAKSVATARPENSTRDCSRAPGAHDEWSADADITPQCLNRDDNNEEEVATSMMPYPSACKQQMQPLITTTTTTTTRDTSAHISIAGSLLCGSTAGLVTSTATFPLDVIRKRLQTTRGRYARVSFVGMIQQVWKQQGVRGFYSGIIPEYFKVLPGMAIAFGTFEAMRSALGAQHSS